MTSPKSLVECMEEEEEEALVLEVKDVAHWIYRGEGAANLVLGYTGLSPAFVGKVLRVPKAPKNANKPTTDTSILSTHERLLWGNVKDIVSSTSKEALGQMFVLNVMLPLLGSEHVDPGLRVLVAKEFLEAVQNSIFCQRPAWRVDAAKVNTLCGYALLMPDHSVFPHGSTKEGPCISVEIKPKCGFLPCSRFIAEHNAIKRSITRFQMHQVVKLHQGEISQVSKYDPLDLFSESSERISKAVKALFSTPHNNFRIFLNGSLIFGGLGGNADITNVLVGEALEDQIDGVVLAERGLRLPSFLQLIAETIFRSGLMNRLLEAQKLDSVDIEGAIHAYYNIVSQPCQVCEDLGDNELRQRFLSLHSISLDESLKIVRDYLVAATAKDCSLMISLRPRMYTDEMSPYSTVYLESTNQSFDYKAFFIDLDMKPMEKMVYYYELDQKILSFYNKMIEHGQSDC